MDSTKMKPFTKLETKEKLGESNNKIVYDRIYKNAPTSVLNRILDLERVLRFTVFLMASCMLV